MYIDKIKAAIGLNGVALDQDLIEPLIDAAKSDLKLCGILATKVDDETDSLVLRAISLYVDSHFKPGDPMADRKLMSYESIRNHLSMSAEYTEEVV